MDLSRRLLPVDPLVAAYNALLASLWATVWTRAAYAPWIFAAHAAAALVPWLFTRVPGHPSRRLEPLRDVYPLIWLTGFWSELGLLRHMLHANANDRLVADLDLAVFGTHLNSVWMPAMPHLWVSELMHFLYFAYYALLIVPPLVLLWGGRMAALRDLTLRLMVAYIACYVIYLAFPTDGPRHVMPPYAGPLNEGIFYRIVHDALELGDSMGTAFPSSHVVGAVTIAYVGWQWFSPGVAAVLSAEAVGVIVSTVYTQNHYAIDSLAGAVWGLGLQIVLVPALLRWLEPRPAVLPVPVLPRIKPAAAEIRNSGARR